jgi:hypothetical protein
VGLGRLFCCEALLQRIRLWVGVRIDALSIDRSRLTPELGSLQPGVKLRLEGLLRVTWVSVAEMTLLRVNNILPTAQPLL